MDFGGLIFLAVLWVLFRLVAQTRRSDPRAGRAGTPPATRPGRDPTATQGSPLQQLLRELERAMDQAQVTPGRAGTPRPAPARRRLPGAAAGETIAESGVERPEREVVDQDEEAERTIARRAAATLARSGPIGETDHQRFERRMQEPSPEPTAPRRLTAKQLRDAMVWREVLGPPVALRPPQT